MKEIEAPTEIRISPEERRRCRLARQRCFAILVLDIVLIAYNATGASQWYHWFINGVLFTQAVNCLHTLVRWPKHLR